MWSTYDAWKIKESDFPIDGEIREKILFIVQYAMLAPSTFNSQPWLCSVEKNTLSVYLNKHRIIHKSDPDGRFAAMSVGAFIKTFLVASHHFGLGAELETCCQESQDSILLGKIKITVEKQKPIDTRDLFSQIVQRATNRSSSLEFTLLPEDIQQLHTALRSNNCNLHILNTKDQNEIAKISSAADLRIWSDREFRKEHAQWVRHNLTTKPDGMPGFGVGVGLLASLLAKPVILSDKFAQLQTKKNQQLIATTPYFGVLTGDDKGEGWVEVGQALQLISLMLSKMGLSAAPMGQFIADDQARQQLKTYLNSTLQPQVVWRIIKPSKSVKHSPRLSLSDIMMISE